MPLEHRLLLRRESWYSERLYQSLR
jgi:hypothetical protein